MIVFRSRKQLESYKPLERRADITYQEWQRLERRKANLKASTHDMPKMSNKRLLDSVILELDVLAEKYYRQYLQSLRIRQQIEDYIASIEDPLHQNIISMRYIEGLTYREIADRMHYSITHIHRILNNPT